MRKATAKERKPGKTRRAKRSKRIFLIVPKTAPADVIPPKLMLADPEKIPHAIEHTDRLEHARQYNHRTGPFKFFRKHRDLRKTHRAIVVDVPATK